MQVSVFTPTYNRAYILPKLYESLKAQTCQDFEWVLVDDGSTDETSQLVQTWLADGERRFPLNYIVQENAGKQAAWNVGLAQAQAPLFFPIDSDDHFTADAIEQAIAMIATISDRTHLIGASGVRVFPGNNPTGGVLQQGPRDYLSSTRRSEGIDGDLAEVFFTDTLRKYPFPHFEGEKFVPEALIFNRFSNDGYRIRGFATPLCYCEYLPDGYTKNTNALLIRNWKGYSLYVKELMQSPVPLKAKVMPLGGYVYRWLLRTLHLVK